MTPDWFPFFLIVLGIVFFGLLWATRGTDPERPNVDSDGQPGDPGETEQR